MNPIKTFRAPAEICFGTNSTKEAGRSAKRIGGSKALLVTDKFLHESGIIEPALTSLSEEKIDYVIYDGVNSEPTLDHVDEGLRIFKNESCDVLISCGGGSPIDTAKAIGTMATHPGKIEDYKGLNQLTNSTTPHIAIPTTAGTGSEVTIFTIITDTNTDVKMLIGSPELMPSVALVDPLLTINAPRGITAATGIDALTHAIEAYVSQKAHPMSNIFAISAINLISKYLPQAWANPNNLEARSNTMLGALQAGLAFSNASVALVHGMSRPIGANFHVPHGMSNAALLSVVTEFSVMGAPDRYAQIAASMGINTAGLTTTAAAQAGVEEIKRLVNRLEIPTLSGFGIKKEQLDSLAEKMAEDAIASGSPGNNPRIASKEEIVKLYYAAL
jgi:alcohol dehydrogenase class IV